MNNYNLKVNIFCYKIQYFDPLGRPTIPAGSDNYFCTCPSVRPHFANLAKQKQQKIIVTAGETVGLAEWIIDDTCLVFFVYFCNLLKPYIRPYNRNHISVQCKIYFNLPITSCQLFTLCLEDFFLTLPPFPSYVVQLGRQMHQCQSEFSIPLVFTLILTARERK